jgi:hypothetical protein
MKLTVKIRYTEKIVEIYRENPGFLRKRPTFQTPGDAPDDVHVLFDNF